MYHNVGSFVNHPAVDNSPCFLVMLSTVGLLLACLFAAGCMPDAPLSPASSDTVGSLASPSSPASTTSPISTRKRREVGVLVHVVDQSTSTSADWRCEEVLARVISTMSLPGIRALDVMVLGTGGAFNNEPSIIVPWIRFRPRHDPFTPGDSIEVQRQRYLKDIHAQCSAHISRTHSSPIFTAIARGVESLRAHCSEVERSGDRCTRKHVSVASDMRENGQASITARLYRRHPRFSTGTLPVIEIDNDITLSICGVANYSDTDSVSGSRLRAVWTEVFSNRLPAFDAACARTSVQ
ncbi:MAG: hypothetical protein WC526_00810 [Patescibacteria group bacterium]